MADMSHLPHDSDDYIEAYHFSHIQENIRIYIIYMVSNIGPGKLNNGVAVLIHRDNHSRVITAEYSERSFKAIPLQTGIRSGRSFFRICGPDCVYLRVKLDELEIKLKLVKLAMGPKMVHKDRNIVMNKNEYVSAFVGISDSKSSGSIILHGKTKKLEGHAGMEFFRTNVLPYKYAIDINLSRSMGANGIFLGYYTGVSKEKPVYGRVAIKLNKKYVFEDVILKKVILARSSNRITDFEVAQKTTYLTKKNCQIIETRQKSTGGFKVLDKVTPFLRWILKILFSNPHVLHFLSEIKIDCSNSKTEWKKQKIFSNVLTSAYIMNH